MQLVTERERGVLFRDPVSCYDFKSVLSISEKRTMATGEMMQKVGKSLAAPPDAPQMTRGLAWDRKRASALSGSLRATARPPR
jgi:hypothetical protein